MLKSIRTQVAALRGHGMVGSPSARSNGSPGIQPAVLGRGSARLLGAATALLRRPVFIPLTLIVVTIALALWRLEGMPPLWWDEGWTLCDARSWVELGHYGCLVAGEPGPSTLSAAFPVVAPIALSFRLFGVGIWQARIVGVLFTVGSLVLLYHLSDKLFNRSVAIVTLIFLLLVPDYRYNPVYVGKQAMAEMPALFYLLAGYTAFYWTLRKSWLFLPLALGFWGVALMTKAQVWPFWAVSLAVPLAVALVKRRWRAVALLAVGLFGSNRAAQLVLLGKQILVNGNALGRAPVSGLVETVANAPLAVTRLGTLRFVALYGALIPLGLGHALWKWVRNFRECDLNNAEELVRLMLLVLAGSWFGWYALLSIGWGRYLFPAAFLSSPFIASLLYDLTNGFDLRSTLQEAALALKTRQFRQHAKAVSAYFMIILISFYAVQAVRGYRTYLTAGDTLVLNVTRFLNTATPPDALIETDETELFVFLDRPYHYPPAQVSVELVRRKHLGEDAPIDYDPLAADPDYLVVGRYSRAGRLYEPVLETGAFRLVRTFGVYEVYARVR